ncbi:MAG: transcriptional regulator [Oscillospiraceae bacterium]|jgi:putative transcriptional regulator|nr:transcriptional regulator [Oscillospiraceae bacterium]
MERYDYYGKLKESLEQAVAYNKGDKSRVRISVRELPIPEYKADDVQRLRFSLNLSQRGFAAALGVSARTVEAWEIGRNVPNGAARNLLYLLDHNSKLVDQLIIRQSL